MPGSAHGNERRQSADNGVPGWKTGKGRYVPGYPQPDVSDHRRLIFLQNRRKQIDEGF